MIAGSAAALLIPVLAAFLGLALLWPATPAGRAVRLLIAMLAIPLGLGLSSLGFFLWLVVVGPQVTGLFVLELILLAVLAVQVFRQRRTNAGRQVAEAREVSGQQLRLLYVAVALLLTLALVSFAALSVRNPHGWWDAVSIWNLRARFMFRGGEYWIDGLTPLLRWTQPDYPLLLPGAVARAWKVIGSESTAIPVGIAFLFTFCSAGTLAACVGSLRGRAQGALAAIALLGSGPLVWHAATQYADVPLGLFILATLALLAAHDEMEGVRTGRLLVLAGVTAGLAAWTKNEGLVFVLALLVARLAILAASRGWRASARQGGALLLGLLPVLLVVIGFKLVLAPPNDMFALQQSAGVLERLGDPARYRILLGGLLDAFVFFGSGWLGMPVMLAAYGLMVGRARRPLDTTAVATIALTLGLVLGVYILVFLVTPYDLEWHLYTALYRLLLHLWPGLLLGYFLAVRSPEEILKEESPAQVGQGSVSAAI
jgi:hypothetical protein